MMVAAVKDTSRTPAVPVIAPETPAKAVDPQTAKKADPAPLPDDIVKTLNRGTVHHYESGAVALDLPGKNQPGVAPQTGTPTQGPAQAGAAAAGGTSPQTAAAVEGTQAALDEMNKAAHTQATLNLIRNGVADETAVVSGNIKQGSAEIAQIIATNDRAFFAAHPEMKKHFAQIYEDLKKTIADAARKKDPNVDLSKLPQLQAEQLTKQAFMCMGREVYMNMNGAQTDIEGKRLIAIPSWKHRLAIADKVAEQVIKETNLTPEVAQFVRHFAGQMKATALKAIARAVSQGIVATEVAHGVVKGEIPANMPKHMLEQTVRGIRIQALRDLGKANRDAYTPEYVAAESERIARGKGTEIPYKVYQGIAHEAILETLARNPETHVTFYDPKTGGVFSPRDDQLRAAAVAYQPSSSSRDLGMPTGASDQTPGFIGASQRFGESHQGPERLNPLGDPRGASVSRARTEWEAELGVRLKHYLELAQTYQNIAERRARNGGQFRRDPILRH